MTSKSAIFDGIVNLIAPVEASLKSIFDKIIWKSWNSYSLKVKYSSWICILTNQKTANPFRSISYGLWDNGKFTFSRSCDLEGHVTKKSKISKFVILHAVTL